jgi:hypothetical protein
VQAALEPVNPQRSAEDCSEMSNSPPFQAQEQNVGQTAAQNQVQAVDAKKRPDENERMEWVLIVV